MIPVIILLLVGLVLLAAEVVVPGGVLGIIGGVVLLAGIVVAYLVLDQTHATLVLGISVLAAAAVVILEFAVLPRSRLARALSMTGTVTGRSTGVDGAAAAMVGREGIAQTMLVPSGYVIVEGRRFEAFSRDGAIEAGARIRVVGVDNFRLIVGALSS